MCICLFGSVWCVGGGGWTKREFEGESERERVSEREREQAV